MKKTLTEESIGYMQILMCNETIANKVKSAAKEGRSYKIFTICDDGIVVLGETNCRWWNRLIGCQFELTFESWAIAVWDALVDLSSGLNAEAIKEGLSTEIVKKAQREDEYNWVVARLHDCYVHICNGKSEAPLEGGRVKSGPSVVVTKAEPAEQNIILNINTKDFRRTFKLPDATGRTFIDLEMGVVNAHISKDHLF